MATSQTQPKALSKNAKPVRKPSHDAVALLKADHAEVKKCFKDYQKLVKNDADVAEREALATEICKMLTVHAQIEEEIFYPAARDLLGDEETDQDAADGEGTDGVGGTPCPFGVAA